MSKEKDLVGFRVQSLEYQTKLTKKFANRKPWKEPNPYEIASYIPGTIIDIQVEVGQTLKEGDNVLVLEAMNNLMYKTPELLRAPPPGPQTNLFPASVTN